MDLCLQTGYGKTGQSLTVTRMLSRSLSHLSNVSRMAPWQFGHCQKRRGSLRGITAMLREIDRLVGSDTVRNNKRSAALVSQHLVGLMIAHETIGNGIEMELSFQPVRYVSQQAESCREVGFIDLGGGDIPP